MYVLQGKPTFVPPPIDPDPGSCAPASFLAPPAGAVMRARSRGMGQANCPSMEQLLQITDCSDPCQAASPGCGVNAGGAYTTIPTPAGDFQLVGSTLFSPSGTVVSGAPGAPASSSSAMNWAPWIVGGAALLLGLALLKGLK
jgi:hypothetical protein